MIIQTAWTSSVELWILVRCKHVPSTTIPGHYVLSHLSPVISRHLPSRTCTVSSPIISVVVFFPGGWNTIIIISNTKGVKHFGRLNSAIQKHWNWCFSRFVFVKASRTVDLWLIGHYIDGSQNVSFIILTYRDIVSELGTDVWYRSDVC